MLRGRQPRQPTLQLFAAEAQTISYVRYENVKPGEEESTTMSHELLIRFNPPAHASTDMHVRQIFDLRIYGAQQSSLSTPWQCFVPLKGRTLPNEERLTDEQTRVSAPNSTYSL